MSKNASTRQFDADGILVAGVGQPLPEGVKTYTLEEISTPADPEFPAGGGVDLHDPVNDPAVDAVTEVPLHTPAEQALVDAGVMTARTSGGLSKAPTAKPAKSDK